MRRLPWLALVLLACDVDAVPGAHDTVAPAGEIEAVDVWTEAAALHGVPADLLQAIAVAATGVQMVVGEEEFPGRPRAFGVLALREDVAEEAAALAGVSVEDALTERRAHVLASAALLGAWGREAGLDAEDDVGAWAPVIARWADIAEPDALASFVHDGVYAVLRTGAAAEDVRVKPRAVVAAWPEPARAPLTGQSGAVWRPSPNYNSRGGNPVDFVVVHTCEGAYAGCWGWLTNSSAGVSAHYVVKEDGAEVSQLVDEGNRAWHVSATYDCARNGGQECGWTGTSTNTISVGIEHGGYGSQTSFDSRMIQRSAELVCGVTRRHGIARDGYHVLAHGQLQPWNRTDPGPNWPWADYLDRARVACGDVAAAPATLTVDNSNARNDASVASFSASTAWRASTNVGGYHATGYAVAASNRVTSDPASFRFKVSTAGCYALDAWWTAATDRTTAAVYTAFRADGAQVGRFTVDQQRNGGRWNTLGVARLTSGWNRLDLSRWIATGKVAVADAVRVRPGTGCP